MTRKRTTRRSKRQDAALDDVASRLHSVAIQLLRRAWARDAEMGLSRARSSALSVLVFRGAMTLTELAAAEHVTAATMSKLVAALEADGWIERVAHPRDARAVQLSATREGRALIEQGRRRRVEAVRAVLNPLGAAEVETVARAVQLLEAALAPRA
jgi:DNA-binding MarR family transcriptional regulator